MARPPSSTPPSRLSPAPRCRRAPSSAARLSPRRATSRRPLPGDHRPVDHMSASAASRPRNPRTGIRGLFRFPQLHPQAIRSIKEVNDMTITVLDRRDGTADALLPATLGELHDTADTVLDDLLPCRVNDSDLWFAESPADVEFAKVLCQDCPVRGLCLSGALERREPWGVWGGELFLQGVVIPRKRPRGRPRKNEQAA